MWITFNCYYRWTPPEDRRVRICFKAGHTYFVRRQCAVEALASGKAVKAKRPAVIVEQPQEAL